MPYKYTHIDELRDHIFEHLKAHNIFDLPQGRHQATVDEFYISRGLKSGDDFADKLRYIDENMPAFNQFLDSQDRLKSGRLNAERQAELEPERNKLAIKTLSEMGFDVKIVSNTEINFTYKGEIVRYYPYSGWAAGKTIKDGRGLKNLIGQLVPDEAN